MANDGPQDFRDPPGAPANDEVLWWLESPRTGEAEAPGSELDFEPVQVRAIGRVLATLHERTPKLGPGFRWILDGTKVSTLEYLREQGDHLPPWWRRRIAQAAFDSLLENSVLGSLIADPPTLEDLLAHPPDRDPPPHPEGRLRPKVRLALCADLLLRGLESPETYRTHREHITAARDSLELFDAGQERDDDPALAACDTLEEELAMLQDLAERLEGWVEDAGFRYDWEKRRILIPPGSKGGLPRTLFSDLVRRFVLHLKISDHSEIDRVATELFPFLDPAILDTSRGSPLYRALYYWLDEK